VFKQRYRRKKGTLREDRVKRLDEVEVLIKSRASMTLLLSDQVSEYFGLQ
jgi:hypothetical protein